MMGYYKMPEKTKEQFTEDGFLKTGDLGEIDEKGRLRITGRAKEQFKTSKGKYVAPAPIENMLAVSNYIEACCVTGSGYPQPYAVLMLSEDAREAIGQENRSTIEKDLADHIDGINRKLPHHERLAFVVVTKDEWLPENGYLTPTMKLKRSKLEEVYGPQADGWYEENKQVVWQE